jgi:hypothetical protein
VRQSAWLNAVPETVGTAGNIANAAATPLSRLQKMRADLKDESFFPVMPFVDAEHIIGYLFEIGPSVSGGMSQAPITHGEIAAWQANIGVELQPWEARFLRSLSIEYIGQSVKSEKPDCPAPYGIAERRALVAKKIDDIFG